MGLLPTIFRKRRLTDDVFVPDYLHVWANLTVGTRSIPLVEDALGATTARWPAPDEALSDVVLLVEVQDPFSAQGTATQAFGVTRQSPLALVIAILIAVAIFAFLIFGFLRARKRELGPPTVPPTPPTAPSGPPMAPSHAGAAPPSVERKTCPRCHTPVNAADVMCFFCGYPFPEETKIPP